MKAAVLEDCNSIVVKDVPTPEPQKGEVLVRVAYTGICGSDVPRVLQGAVHGYPIILGHEFSGRIEAVGPEVDSSLVGTRVVGVPLRPCGECDVCGRGLYSLCKHYGFIGSRQNGSMAEYVCLPVKNVLPIGDDVSDIHGAFFEPATVAIHAIELLQVKPAAKIAVVGGGTIGTLTALALQDYYPSSVVVTRRSADKFGSLKSVGLNQLVASEEPDWKEKALAMAQCSGFDYVFDAAGTPETILQSLELAGPRGKICFIGTPKRKVELTVQQWELINRKELIVTGSWMSYSYPWPGVEWEKARRLFASGILRITSEMIDSIFELNDTAAAFQRFEDKKVQGKVLIHS